MKDQEIHHYNSSIFYHQARPWKYFLNIPSKKCDKKNNRPGTFPQWFVIEKIVFLLHNLN